MTGLTLCEDMFTEVAPPNGYQLDARVHKVRFDVNQREATVTGLVSSPYTLVETKAPTEYLLDETPWTIRFKAGGDVSVRLTVENTWTWTSSLEMAISRLALVRQTNRPRHSTASRSREARRRTVSWIGLLFASLGIWLIRSGKRKTV
ncbi:prealbumin-like fold domain-containing protein [Exiguobacterium sp. SH31]|uniref:prealbumin-like fold domain-containing protein n=1 Tax=Exiguobacterium sp. SH31 TaxID=1843183 RepID=UPI0011EA6898|nr:prealbumin-like fold domain-containing protein [Exiguobacterium sp. SH31]